MLLPFERFMAVEAASGIVLLIATAIALLWANSPWRASYGALWHMPISLAFFSTNLERDLHFLINDALMTIFFFVVGLEIRREIHDGELSEWRRAALPLAATIGGMLVPAALYFAINHGQPSVRGSGIPMATDIAFAVGVLTLLGKRVPHALRILLLALAVIDDVGAIVAIALFYATGFEASGLLAMGLGLLGIIVLQRMRVRSAWAYVPAAVVVWAGCYIAGIHPTLSGVVVGLMTPVVVWPGGEGAPPVERLQHTLHGWVSYGIMPLFALANAGVALGEASLSGDSMLVFTGVLTGLLLGKPLGILLFAWAAVSVGVAVLPRGTTWPQISLVGLLGGIGFTMALFIAQLAFPSGTLLESAKLGILCASGAAALLAFAIGRLLLWPRA